MSATDKKRKRESHDSFPTAQEIKIKTSQDTTFIPIVATTPGVQIPLNASLTAYSRPRAAKKSKTNAVEYIVHGSTETIDYEGRELDEDAQIEKYYLGIYDPKTGVVEVHPAPRVHVRREIKAFRERDAQLLRKNTVIDGYLASRAALGAEFGTKKSKKAIQMRDLNQINVKEMDSAVTTSIVSQIGENTESMPTREDLEKDHEARRLLPPHKTEGITSPSQIYNLEDLVSKEEMELLWIKEWYDTVKNGGVVQVPNNTHVTNRITKLSLAKTKSPTNDRKLKLLKYISILRNLYVFLCNRVESERLLLSNKVIDIRKRIGVSEELCNILLRKFTEVIGGPSSSSTAGEKLVEDLRQRRKATPANLAKLLHYLAILCLMVEDNYQVDVYYLKDDLGLQTKDVLQVFSNVGCKKKDIQPAVADSMGIPKGQQKLHKVAYLTAKPEYPKPKTRRRAAAKR